MNWNPFNWFRGIAQDETRKAFAVGIFAARDEYVTAYQADALKARRQGLEDTLEAIDYADSLADSNPAKAAAIDLFKQGLIDQARTIQGLMQNPLPAGKERDEALAAPFGDADFSKNGTAALPSPEPRALPNGTPEPTSNSKPSAKRGPGRPRKHPKPDFLKVGQEGEPSPAGPEGTPE